MLGVLEGDGCHQALEDKPLKHLDSGAEEGDGAVGGAG